MATAIPLFLVAFAAAYFVMGEGQAGSFSEPLTRTDALYYTVTIFSTVGFGDITPTTQPTRIVTMIQMLVDLVIFGVVARALVNAVGAGPRHRTAGAAEPSATDEAPPQPTS